MANKDEREKIGNIFGEARYIEFFKNGKQVHNVQNTEEVFFTIEKRKENGNGYNKKYGYVKLTSEMRMIFTTLFQERRKNMHLTFIEWKDCYNVVFSDGIYISEKMCKLEKNDFSEWEETIQPA